MRPEDFLGKRYVKRRAAPGVLTITQATSGVDAKGVVYLKGDFATCCAAVVIKLTSLELARSWVEAA